ncbi:MAG TPA: hypothetical protein ENH24_02625 [Nitrospirae bacterium]|nr:hypothetical protein [Nitrospirota bacterium]
MKEKVVYPEITVREIIGSVRMNVTDPVTSKELKRYLRESEKKGKTDNERYRAAFEGSFGR